MPPTPTTAAKTPPAKTPKVLLVCSSGGHLLQLYSLLGPLWSRYDRAWVCFDKADARSLLSGERVTWAFSPTNRNVPNLVRNALLARRVLRAERPDVVVSSGAGVGVPFIALARTMGIETIYLESFARKSNLSLTGRLLYPVARHFVVQSDALRALAPRAVFRGTVY